MARKTEVLSVFSSLLLISSVRTSAIGDSLVSLLSLIVGDFFSGEMTIELRQLELKPGIIESVNAGVG